MFFFSTIQAPQQLHPLTMYSLKNTSFQNNICAETTLGEFASGRLEASDTLFRWHFAPDKPLGNLWIFFHFPPISSTVKNRLLSLHIVDILADMLS